MKRAVVLLSGGLDSTTTLAIAKSEGFDVYALSFWYGQKHAIEVEKAKEIATALNVRDHLILTLDFSKLGDSALTSSAEVPKDREFQQISDDIPVTYVPARNTIFLSFGLALAEGIGAEDIFYGANAVDYSGYPDCRPEYIQAFETLANLATRSGVKGNTNMRVHAPLLHMSKSEIILKGKELKIPFHLTHSCYDPSQTGKPCGRCDSCQLRKKGFQEAQLKDPLL